MNAVQALKPVSSTNTTAAAAPETVRIRMNAVQALKLDISTGRSSGGDHQPIVRIRMNAVQALKRAPRKVEWQCTVRRHVSPVRIRMNAVQALKRAVATSCLLPNSVLPHRVRIRMNAVQALKHTARSSITWSM
jgi:hypothetical protein